MKTPSKYQQAIYDWAVKGDGSAVIEAVAGSGKTTTIIEVLNRIPPSASVLMLAFNKSIADELAERVPANVTVKTFNGLGHSMLRKTISVKLELTSWKVRNIARRMLPRETYEENGNDIVALVGFAKRTGVSPSSILSEWVGLITHFGIGIPTKHQHSVIEYARAILQTSNEAVMAEGLIDFDDQVYIPTRLSARGAEKYDWVFVDEAQDASVTRIKLAQHSLAENGRLVACGDSHQAIYGFTGASANAMSQFVVTFEAKVFPLSISYRCARRIVEAAQEVMPIIEAADTAPAGEVTFSGTKWSSDTFLPGDMVVCRMNGPLVSLAWQLVADGVACRILGRNISSGLVSIIKGLKITRLSDLRSTLGKWHNDAKARLDPEEDALAIEQLDDKCMCILAIYKRSSASSLKDFIASIENLFADEVDSSNTVTLCSVHKSKGLEADRVFILNRDSMPSVAAKLPWQMAQEKNLIYVAITRAKHSLFLIDRE
jgi:DNA helicase-2/ATP-dependent DNA helicase PcrA